MTNKGARASRHLRSYESPVSARCADWRTKDLQCSSVLCLDQLAITGPVIFGVSLCAPFVNRDNRRGQFVIVTPLPLGFRSRGASAHTPGRTSCWYARQILSRRQCWEEESPQKRSFRAFSGAASDICAARANRDNRVMGLAGRDTIELFKPGGEGSGIEAVIDSDDRRDQARALYRRAVMRYPRRLIMLCDRARVLARSDPAGHNVENAERGSLTRESNPACAAAKPSSNRGVAIFDSLPHTGEHSMSVVDFAQTPLDGMGARLIVFAKRCRRLDHRRGRRRCDDDRQRSSAAAYSERVV